MDLGKRNLSLFFLWLKILRMPPLLPMQKLIWIKRQNKHINEAKKKQRKRCKSLERVISAEERIRKAEEIYQRRKNQNSGGVRVSTRNVNTGTKREYMLFKKLILQIAICLLIYLIFYLIKNSNYIFSENVINKTREILSYDIDFQKLYTSAEEYYNNNLKGLIVIKNNEETTNEIEHTETNEQAENANEENINEQTVNEQTTNEQVEGGIGGGEDSQEEVSQIAETSADEEQQTTQPLSQMEEDAKYIKENYSFTLPLKGTITSRYGPRTPTEIVSANHAGIDIAVNAGTKFVAAMEGEVTLVSDEGGYGNHVYIQNGDVVTLYAHCKTIYVKQGDKIAKGEQIGEVGDTGNATGPHLHFEIRRENRIVNPEYVLDF